MIRRMAMSPKIYEIYKTVPPYNAESAEKVIDAYLMGSVNDQFPSVKFNSQLSYDERCKIAEAYLYSGWKIVAHYTSDEVWDTKGNYTKFIFISQESESEWRHINDSHSNYNEVSLNILGEPVFVKVNLQ